MGIVILTAAIIIDIAAWHTMIRYTRRLQTALDDTNARYEALLDECLTQYTAKPARHLLN